MPGKLFSPRFSALRLGVAFILVANLTVGPLVFAGGNAPAAGKKPSPKAAQAGQLQGGQREIPPEGQRQIAALIAEKNSRTPAQRKIASRLLQGVRESRGEQMTPGVKLEKVDLKLVDGKVAVDITATVTDSLLTQIGQLGGTIIFPSVKWHAIRALVPLSAVETIAGYPEVKFIRTAVPSKTLRMTLAPGGEGNEGGPFDLGLTGPILPTGLAAASLPVKPTFAERAANVRNYLSKILGSKARRGSGFIGKITSEGVAAVFADTAMQEYGFEGEGVNIGVLSDSYNFLGGAATDVSTGDLPGPGNPYGNTTPVTVVQDLPINKLGLTGSDEGRAILQVVADMAPKANLFFATADISEAGFATNIERLRNPPYNCNIILDDVGYFDEAVFSDGPVAQAVNFVTNSGGLYFSAAGNAGNVFSNTAGYWEGDFTDTGSAALPVLATDEPGNPGTIMNWGTVALPLVGNVILQAGEVYTLDWADPEGASTNDYDLFVLSKTGTVKALSTDFQGAGAPGNPHEEIDSPSFAAGDELVVYKSASAAYRAIAVNISSEISALSPGLTKFTVGQIHGHSSAATGAYGVAAVGALETGNTVNGRFTTASNVEYFSSDGPRRVFFNPDGTPVLPGGTFTFAGGPSGYTTRQQPAVSSADFVSTTGASLGAGLNPFAGTSCATPHAAATAALLMSANPHLSPSQIMAILTNPANTIAIDTLGTAATGGGPLPNPTVGYGIPNAALVVGAGINTAPTTTDMADIALGTIIVTESTTFSNKNTLVEPGEVANVSVQLTNPSLVNATSVTATLTSTTPGVTVATGSPFIATSITAGGNTTAAFTVAIGNTVPCGTTVGMQVNVTYTGGIPLTLPFNFTLGDLIHQFSGTLAGVSAMIGTPPTAPVGAGYTATGGVKTGTLSRNGIQATCAAPKTAASVITGTGFSKTSAGDYGAFTFTNPTGVSTCFTVTVNADLDYATNAAVLQTAAFSTFIPTGTTASLATGTNYLADPGTRATTMTYSLTVAAGASFTVVVYDASTASNAFPVDTYQVSVVESTCAAGQPACTPMTFTPTTLPAGTTGIAYSQTFTVKAGTGSGDSALSIGGALPGGLTLSGKTLSGTPTEAGTFPITVTATDDTGCVGPTTNSYTLVINGTLPVSITASGGGGQTALVGASFTTDLQATVLDGGSHPLLGVSVLFTAPTTGATGTFTGGASTATVVTGANGVATAPTFTANATAGGYTVTATVVGIATPASFGLVNSCPGSFVVTSNADSGPGTLRSILENACDGAQVTFAANVTGTITLTSGYLDIEKSVTITGPGANILAINGNAKERVFAIGLSNVANTVIISGLTITNGVTPASGTELFGGGGVLINAGTVNLTDDAITNNDCTNSTVNFGGGVDNEGTGSLTITRCSITGNTSIGGLGGGVFSEGTTMLITETTIAGNSTGEGGGGGGLGVGSNSTMFDSTIYGNTASFGGNVITIGEIVRSPALSFGNSIIAGGILVGAGAEGADIFNDTADGTGVLTSLNYNLIEDTTNDATPTPGQVTIGGTKTNNITGVSPNLLPLAIYGGSTQSLLPAPNSPIITKGNPAPTAALDQRAFPRVIGGTEDIGAVETDYALAATSGGGQSAPISTKFTNPLKATVTESGNDIAGVTVTFTPPASGASATLTPETAVTNPSGVATSPALTANGTTGTYSVTASIGLTIPTVSFSLTNNTCSAITVGPATIPAGTVGAAYTSTQFTETGGVGTTTFSETGTLPAGLTLTIAGVLSGTPTQSGSFPITVTATDSHGCTGSTAYTLAVGCAAITVGPATIPAGTVESAYTTQFTQTGGVGTTTFSETGSLPSGLTLTTAGVLSGTPTVTGSFPITVKATDSHGCSGSKAYTVSIGCSTITVTPTTVPASVEFESYQVQFAHTGGVGAVTFSTASALPAGLTLSTAGLLSGTPTQSGTFSIVVKATDTKGCSGSVTVSLNVSSLNMCLHDDHNGDFIQFSSTTGAYLFTQCGTGAITVSGTGTIKVASGVLTITDKESNKTVTITYNNGSLTGTAVVTVSTAPGLSQTYKISDTNPHPICSCSATP
jgi:hypothetical protein